MSENKNKEDLWESPITALGRRMMVKRAQQTLWWAILYKCTHSRNLCEVGTGRGILMREACRNQWSYTGFDLKNPSLIPWEDGILIAQRVPPFPPNFPLQDVFVLENVIEHIPSYEKSLDLLIAVYNQSRYGGVIILRFPDVRLLGNRFWHTPDHEFVTTLEGVGSMLCEAGFTPVLHGYAFDHLTGLRGFFCEKIVQCIAPFCEFLHRLKSKPWEKDVFSKIAGKRRHGYIVAIKRSLKEDYE